MRHAAVVFDRGFLSCIVYKSCPRKIMLPLDLKILLPALFSYRHLYRVLMINECYNNANFTVMIIHKQHKAVPD